MKKRKKERKRERERKKYGKSANKKRIRNLSLALSRALGRPSGVPLGERFLAGDRAIKGSKVTLCQSQVLRRILPFYSRCAKRPLGHRVKAVHSSSRPRLSSEGFSHSTSLPSSSSEGSVIVYRVSIHEIWNNIAIPNSYILG